MRSTKAFKKGKLTQAQYLLTRTLIRKAKRFGWVK